MRRQRNLLGPQGMGGMVSLWGASSLIRSVQYFSGTVNAATTNFTISAVDMANTVVLPLGVMSSYADESFGVWQRAFTLSTATNVALIAGNWVGETAYGVVLEFAPGVIKSLQTGNISLFGATAVTATITSVNTAKTIVLTSVKSNGDNLSANVYDCTGATLTNATTITASRNSASGIYIPFGYYFAVEFF